MEFHDLIQYCFQLKGATETYPFDNKTLVMKVMGKMFLLVDVHDPQTINIKCDPEKAIELRKRYVEIEPGYHMNKKHWNTVNIKGSLSHNFIQELILHSYELVVASLPKKLQNELTH